MDFWKSSQKQKGWDYIKTIDPDICLLNECSNPNLFINYIHNEQTNGWGCGVFSKHKLNEIIILITLLTATFLVYHLPVQGITITVERQVA